MIHLLCLTCHDTISAWILTLRQPCQCVRQPPRVPVQQLQCHLASAAQHLQSHSTESCDEAVALCCQQRLSLAARVMSLSPCALEALKLRPQQPVLTTNKTRELRCMKLYEFKQNCSMHHGITALGCHVTTVAAFKLE